MTVTLDSEVSPRRIELVRVTDLPTVFASTGKVNRKTGKPLTVPRLSNLSRDDPDFPKPYLPAPHERKWRLEEVLEYAKKWNQKDGPRVKQQPPDQWRLVSAEEWWRKYPPNQSQNGG